MAVVALTAMRDALMPGLYFASHVPLPIILAEVPEKYQHLRAVFDFIPVRRVGDLHNLPRRIVGGYETVMVHAGREFPQGWGRLRGSEPELGLDGKVDTYRDQDNEKMAALKAEIEDFITEKGWYGTPRAFPSHR